MPTVSLSLDLVCLALMALACTKRVPDAASDPPPAVPSVTPSTSSPKDAPPTSDEPGDAGEVPESATFSLACELGPCQFRGTVRAVAHKAVPIGRGATTSGVWRERLVRAFELEIEPGDLPRCQALLDGVRDRWNRAVPRLPPRKPRVIVLGAGRLAARLGVGARLCGWSQTVSQAGLGYPGGPEGELTDEEGRLLAAWSAAFDRRQPESARLAAAWRFAREGPAARTPAEDNSESGVFVWHDRVRVLHAGASAVSVRGGEAVLRAPDGTFAVAATSDLTEGPVRVYVGNHDSFGFSAVRLNEP